MKRSRVFFAAAIALLILATASGTAYFLRPLLQEGRLAVSETRHLVNAVRTGEVQVELKKHATELEAMKVFQFAKLRQVETFRQRDVKRVLWNKLSLPDVVIEISVPVEYAYTLDLEREWHFTLEKIGFEESRISVIVPRIGFNAPSADLSAMSVQVIEGSILRDESAVRENLRKRVTSLLEARAAENIALIREVGRRNTTQFLQRWLAGRYADAGEFTVEVTFEDELDSVFEP